ncbi:MAG: hydrophobe/amphiphile efflux-3 (HAE3) family protein [Myxococcota bacterium]|jgi:hydrophobe/amphiphile efflux-3 (HAE3) family protein
MRLSADIVVRHPWFFIVFFVVVTLGFATQLPRLVVDPEVKNQLPADMPGRVAMLEVEERFGGSEMIMVVLEHTDVLQPAALTRLKALSDGMAEIEGIDDVMDVFTLTDVRGEDGNMIVEPAVPALPTTPEEVEALRRLLDGNDLVRGNVLAADDSAAAVIGLLAKGAEDQPTIAAVEALIAATPGPGEVFVGGMPDVRSRVSHDIQSDIRRFLPFGLAIILGFLWVCFRQLRGVLLPFAVVVMSCVVAMGLIPLLGWKVQMVTVILPVILLAVANDYGIHLLAKYQEENKPGSNHTAEELALLCLRDLGPPVLAAGITTMAGLLCLTTHIIVPAAQLGILASLGVLFALAGSLGFIPAVLAVMPVAPPIAGVGDDGDAGMLERLLAGLAGRVVARPLPILLVVLTGTVLIATGMTRIQVDTNPINYYPPAAPVAQNAARINASFGGSTELSVLVTGDIQDPEVMAGIDALGQAMRAQEGVGFTSSIADVMRKMSKALLGGDGPGTMPDTHDALAQYFLLYSMNGDPEDLERMVDFEYEHALVTARISSLGTAEIAKIVRATEAWLDEHPVGESTKVSGFGPVFVDLVDAVVEGQAISLSLSLVLVFVLVSFTFRSLGAGLYALVPLLMAMPLLFGGMGYLGIELNIVTAMLSSIMVGVGVDYTIHFLWRYREERRAGHDPENAVFRTLTTSGRGIVFNALSVVVGFSVLLVSNFLPVQFFGFLVVVSIGGCLIGALVVLPALCLVFRPSFLEP